MCGPDHGGALTLLFERLFDYRVRSMSRPRVSLTVPPWTAELDYWGRDVGGEWRALVVWSTQVSRDDGSGAVHVDCAAWVPGLHAERVERVSQLERPS
jgi:hypothetical protein